jgi:hypothetical protein
VSQPGKLDNSHVLSVWVRALLASNEFRWGVNSLSILPAW